MCIYTFHFPCDTDEEIRDFEIYLSIISKDVILMLFFPYIFKMLCIYICVCVLKYAKEKKSIKERAYINLFGGPNLEYIGAMSDINKTGYFLLI